MRGLRYMLMVIAAGLAGCAGSAPPYGVEQRLALPGTSQQVWAVAPAINLSGQKLDPVLQADLLHQQLGRVEGLVPLPVNRVIDVFAALRIDQVQSAEQAALVCDLLECDGLIVATITAFDPFDPPKLGASLTLFRKDRSYQRPPNVDPRELVRRAAPATAPVAARPAQLLQAVGMFDAADGSTRQALLEYARGRNDPSGPYRDRLYLVEMDRYCGFVYHQLIGELLRRPALAGG
jgi:hypothetical protein